MIQPTVILLIYVSTCRLHRRCSDAVFDILERDESCESCLIRNRVPVCKSSGLWGHMDSCNSKTTSEHLRCNLQVSESDNNLVDLARVYVLNIHRGVAICEEWSGRNKTTPSPFHTLTNQVQTCPKLITRAST